MSNDLRFSFTVTASPGPPSRCRCPDPCPIRPGWDRAHSDSDRPYTLAELEHREDAPHFYAYPTVEEYEQGFYLWRAIRRDQRLTAEEHMARLPAFTEEAVRGRTAE